MATNGENAIHGHVVKTIIDQQHLCPLPLHRRPIFWDYDIALSLFPLPNIVVIGDKYTQVILLSARIVFIFVALGSLFNEDDRAVLSK